MRACVWCHRPFDAPGVECAECKAEKRRLRDLHAADYRCAPEADGEGRELRVELYRAVVERGGTLFEGAT